MRDPEISPIILHELAKDQSSAVRNQLVFNPSLATITLMELANDADRFVRAEARMLVSIAV